MTWYADPAGATERADLRCAGFAVLEGRNALRPGIAAVAARLASGALKVLRGRCPDLLAEAELYRYGEDSDAEAPVDDHNHALAALRYLVSRLDEHRMARVDGAPPEAAKPPRKEVPEWWRRLTNPDIWTRLG